MLLQVRGTNSTVMLPITLFIPNTIQREYTFKPAPCPACRSEDIKRHPPTTSLSWLWICGSCGFSMSFPDTLSFTQQAGIWNQTGNPDHYALEPHQRLRLIQITGAYHQGGPKAPADTTSETDIEYANTNLSDVIDAVYTECVDTLP